MSIPLRASVGANDLSKCRLAILNVGWISLVMIFMPDAVSLWSRSAESLGFEQNQRQLLSSLFVLPSLMMRCLLKDPSPTLA